jgi:opacity protein-like surface antigen
VRPASAFITLALTAGVLAAAAPCRASGLDLRLGAFFPRADSNLFTDAEELYGIDRKHDLVSFTGGIEYNAQLAHNVELGVSVDGYDKTLDTSYVRYGDSDNHDIRQTLKLDIVPMGVTLRLVPTSRSVRIAPYIGVGADLFYWKWEAYGDFIDFGDPDLPIVSDHFHSDGWTGGFHVSGGLRFNVSHDFAVVAEGRYQYAKTTMGDDYSPNAPGLENEIDLSGWNATVGIHIRF